MPNLFFSICFLVASTSFLFVANGQTNWNSLGCNNFEGKYSVDYCYPEWGGDSEKYVCLSDNRVAHYIYGNTDCSGEPSSTYYYGNESYSSYDYVYFQCNASSSCDFAVVEVFDGDSLCSSDERWSFQYGDAYITDICVSGDSGDTYYDDYDSYMASCSKNVITVEQYDNQDCSGSPTNTTIININGSSWTSSGFEHRIYCSSDGGYGQCTDQIDTNWHKLGCNNFKGFYSVGYCYGDSYGDSIKIECLSDDRLVYYEYSDSDCSGVASNTYYYGDNPTYSWYDISYFQCNASSSCDFATLESFYTNDDDDDDSGDGCSEYDRYWSNIELLTGLCVKTDSDSHSDSDEYTFDSYMASCEEDKITLKIWYNDYCHGTPADVTTIDISNASDFVGSSSYDYAFYCSTGGGYGSCSSSSSSSSSDSSGGERNESHVFCVSTILFLAYLFKF